MLNSNYLDQLPAIANTLLIYQPVGILVVIVQLTLSVLVISSPYIDDKIPIIPPPPLLLILNFSYLDELLTIANVPPTVLITAVLVTTAIVLSVPIVALQ